MQDFNSVTFPREAEFVASTFDFFSPSLIGSTPVAQQIFAVGGSGAEFDPFAPLTDPEFDMASLIDPSFNTMADPKASSSEGVSATSTFASLEPSSVTYQPFALADLVDTARQCQDEMIFDVANGEPIVSQVPYSSTDDQSLDAASFDAFFSQIDADVDVDADADADVDDSSEYTTSSLASSPAPSVVPSGVTGGRSRKSSKIALVDDSGVKKPKRKRKTVKEKCDERDKRLQGLITRGVELRQTLRDTHRQLELLKPYVLMLINKSSPRSA